MISAFGIEHNTSISKAANEGKKSNVKRNLAIGGGAALGAGGAIAGGYAIGRRKTKNATGTGSIFEPLKFDQVQFGQSDKKSWFKPGLTRKGPIEEGLNLVAAKGSNVKTAAKAAAKVKI